MTSSPFSVTRRTALAGVAGLGLAMLLSGATSAADTPDITDADAYVRQQGRPT